MECCDREDRPFAEAGVVDAGQSDVGRRTGRQSKKAGLDRVWMGVSLMPRSLT